MFGSRQGTPVTRTKASASSIASAGLEEDVKPDIALAPFHDIKGLPAQLDRVLREESIAGASGALGTVSLAFLES